MEMEELCIQSVKGFQFDHNMRKLTYRDTAWSFGLDSSPVDRTEFVRLRLAGR